MARASFPRHAAHPRLSRYQDIMAVGGYIFALHLAMRVAPAGMVMLAPVCSSWTFMNSGTAKRTHACTHARRLHAELHSLSQPLPARSCRPLLARPATTPPSRPRSTRPPPPLPVWRSILHPLGCVEHPSVRHANTMVSRVATLLWLLCARGIFWILEQPRGSTMQLHPRLQELFRSVTVFRWHTEMLLHGQQIHTATPRPPCRAQAAEAGEERGVREGGRGGGEGEGRGAEAGTMSRTEPPLQMQAAVRRGHEESHVALQQLRMDPRDRRVCHALWPTRVRRGDGPDLL
jgi:hypothetical protein